jgi:acid phosphatase type 7
MNCQHVNKRFPFLFFLLLTATCAGAQEVLVPPYIQPGNVSNLSREQKVIIWQTDSISGTYKVEYTPGSSFASGQKPITGKVSSVTLKLNNKTTILYRAPLTGLKFDESYTYRVSLNNKVIGEATFETRTKKPETRFAVFGDCGTGSSQQAEIAYQVSLQKPQFVLMTGDNVYVRGQEHEYRKNFFPYYLSREATPINGAPLMRSIPFYMVLGNHDVYSEDLDKYDDGMAYFYYNDLPLNAPVPSETARVTGADDKVKMYKKNTAPRFPKMANFSFDYGNVHIVCLDANDYINPLDPALMQWLIEDMNSSKADWKIVSFHHPGFNTSKAHYDYQRMRLLAPVLERLGVDLVLNGHVHNYQRSAPLKFEPVMDAKREMYLISPQGRVDGTFTLDNEFDGQTNTKANGVIYVVTGAGGRALYDTGITENPELWKHEPPENWVPFMKRVVSHIHSFTMIETNGKTLKLQQLDATGNVFDEITMTK